MRPRFLPPLQGGEAVSDLFGDNIAGDLSGFDGILFNNNSF